MLCLCLLVYYLAQFTFLLSFIKTFIFKEFSLTLSIFENTIRTPSTYFQHDLFRYVGLCFHVSLKIKRLGCKDHFYDGTLHVVSIEML